MFEKKDKDMEHYEEKMENITNKFWNEKAVKRFNFDIKIKDMD